MLDVKNLTDTMSRMPLPQLQQYAALHKNDPYIVTLALSIANQKKQMMLSKDGQAGMMPQPKVVDQDIAQMLAPPPQQMPPQQMAAAPQQQALPEDQGIGQLPAQNMQGMAEGGIVGFAGGGDVPGFAGPTGSYIDPLADYLKQIGMSAQEFLAKTGIEQQQIRAQAPVPITKKPPPTVPVAQAAAVKPTGGLTKLLGPLSAAYELYYPASDAEKKASYPYKLGAQSAVDEQGTRIAAAKETAEDYAARKIKEFEATLPVGQKLSPEARNKETDRLIAEKIAAELTAKRQPIDPTGQNPVDPIKSASLKTDKGYNNPPVSASSAPPTSSPAAPSGLPTTKLANPTLPPGVGLPSLNNTAMTPAEAMAAGKQFGDESALTSGIDKLRSDALQTNKDVKSAYDQGISALPKPGAEAEARLKAREAQDAIGQADAKALAIFKAGLGMLAGTSQHAFENIGKGAMVGLEDYASSIKDFRKLAIERDKAYADIENARYAASRDDLKTSVGLQEKAADRLARVDEKGIDVTATLFKTNKETAANIYRDSFDQVQQNARTAATNATSLGVAQINERGANARVQAALPQTLYAQLGAAKEGSPLLKGYNIAKNETQMAHLFESYNKQVNDMMVGPAFRAQFPTFGAYLQEYQKSIGAGGNSAGFTQPPPNATVLPPK